MAIKTQKYKAISKASGQKIRAVRVTERNYLELAKWAGKAPNIISATNLEKIVDGHDITDQRVRLHVAGLGVRVVRVGDYIFKNVTDEGKVTSEAYPAKAADFEATFKLDTSK